MGQNNTVVEIPPRGDFSFVSDEWSRSMLSSAFEAVESVEGGWDALIPEPVGGRGFMFTPRPEGSVLSQIDEAIEERYSGHSGASHAWVMRNMQGIARLGWDDYVRVYINRNREETQQSNLANLANSANSSDSANSNSPVISNTPVHSCLECDETKPTCPICFDYLVKEKSNVYVVSDGLIDGTNTNPVKCGHKYHLSCINEWVQTSNTCPMCRGNIKSIAPLA